MSRSLRVGTALLAVAGAVAVGPITIGGVAATAEPASSAQVWHLHESDSGRTIHVHRWDRIRVRLPGGSMGGYHRPRSSNHDVVHRRWATGGYPSGDAARALFVARHRGAADLTSSTDYTCLHTSPPCLPPQRQWVVHVVVQ